MRQRDSANVLINQIWSSPDSAPALVGLPKARVLEDVAL